MSSEPSVSRLEGILQEPAVWDGPAPELRASLLDAAAAEAANASAGPAALVARPSRTTGHLTTWLVAAAVTAVLAVAGLAFTRGSSETVSLALAGTPNAPEAVGTVAITPTGAGMAITIEVAGLAPAAPGTYYAAWLRGDTGVVPIGSFHVRDSSDEPIELWSAVTLAKYPTLMITLQQEGAPPLPSDVVMLTGSRSLGAG